MKGVSLILGNEVKIKKGQPNRMAKMSAINEEDKMAAEPRARYNLHSHSQNGKVERKEVKLPQLGKPKNKLISLQEKDENLKKRYDQIRKNNTYKFPNTYLEDKRKVRGRLQMTKKKREFKRGEVVPKENFGNLATVNIF